MYVNKKSGAHVKGLFIQSSSLETLHNIHQFRRKAAGKPAQEPVEETPSELRKRLTQELELMDQEDDKEKQEEQQQKIHDSSNKPHWKKAKKKPGPKNKEEDEKLKEKFLDGQVSCASNYDQCFILILLAPTGDLIVMMVYYMYISAAATFSDFHSVH